MKFTKKLSDILIPAALLTLALPGHAQTHPAFTAAQATEGKSAYAQSCAGL
jgi:hypothetical protein